MIIKMKMLEILSKNNQTNDYRLVVLKDPNFYTFMNI